MIDEAFPFHLSEDKAAARADYLLGGARPTPICNALEDPQPPFGLGASPFGPSLARSKFLQNQLSAIGDVLHEVRLTRLPVGSLVEILWRFAITRP